MKLEVKEVALAVVVVGILVVLWQGFGLSMFEWPLMLGKIPSIVLITGPHGGTLTEERVALVVATVLNVALYTLAFWATRVVVRDQRHSEPR